jgi:hypothetical protein
MAKAIFKYFKNTQTEGLFLMSRDGKPRVYGNMNVAQKTADKVNGMVVVFFKKFSRSSYRTIVKYGIVKSAKAKNEELTVKYADIIARTGCETYADFEQSFAKSQPSTIRVILQNNGIDDNGDLSMRIYKVLSLRE